MPPKERIDQNMPVEFVDEDDEIQPGELKRLNRLLSLSDISYHVCPAKPSDSFEEHLGRLLERRHLGIVDPAICFKGVHSHYLNNLQGDRIQDTLQISFCNWNSGFATKLRPDPMRQVKFAVDHGITCLQECDPEGAYTMASQIQGSSYCVGGHMSGLATIQRAKGTCCSAGYLGRST